MLTGLRHYPVDLSYSSNLNSDVSDMLIFSLVPLLGVYGIPFLLSRKNKLGFTIVKEFRYWSEVRTK